jgi:hypothetical protein
LHKRKVETLATILERTTQEGMDDWYALVEKEDDLITIYLNREARCQHLPQLFLDLAKRLHAFKPLGTKELLSESAMMVEESRILQVTIFQTLQKNLGTIDFSVLLLGVMTIADEVDSQLSQSMKSYIAESARAA